MEFLRKTENRVTDSSIKRLTNTPATKFMRIPKIRVKAKDKRAPDPRTIITTQTINVVKLPSKRAENAFLNPL
jgi:hypothetical protein